MLFHGVPWKNVGKNAPCNWNRKLAPVKCQGDSCEKGDATCFAHAGEANASDELKTWLNKHNVTTTLNTIVMVSSCEYNAEPLPTKVSKKVRSKLQSGESASNFSNLELKELFTNDLVDEGNKYPVVHRSPREKLASGLD